MYKTKGEMERFLRKHGCVYKRRGGNHEIWYSPITGKTFTLSHSGIKDKNIYKTIMKQAGIKE
ncbi:MAG: type II toxin-antitoxin system HicA family toxin [Parvibaculales bacterium]